MLRYQAQAERMYRRGIEDFDRLKALRDEMPNEPNGLIQPEQTDEVIPVEQLNPYLEISPETRAPQPEPAPAASSASPVLPNEPNSPAPSSSEVEPVNNPVAIPSNPGLSSPRREHHGESGDGLRS
jgi:hypothetical protein